MNNIGVIFDVDGTIVDSYDPHHESWKYVAAQDGVTFSPEEFHRTFGCVSREIIAMLWPRPVTEQEIKQIDDAKEQAYRDIVSVEFPAMDGVSELMQTLKSQGFSLAVGSSGPRENVELAVKCLEIGGLLDAVVSGSDVKRGKPNPEIFLTAANMMGLPPSRCVVVEDATVGILAAHAAGMKCITLMSTGHKIEEFADADHVIYSLREITPELLYRFVS